MGFGRLVVGEVFGEFGQTGRSSGVVIRSVFGVSFWSGSRPLCCAGSVVCQRVAFFGLGFVIDGFGSGLVGCGVVLVRGGGVGSGGGRGGGLDVRGVGDVRGCGVHFGGGALGGLVVVWSGGGRGRIFG